MSTRVERYLIYGLKFGEEFTKDFWKKDFYDNEVWNKRKLKDKPFFITDGMNGDYTFFGFITELANGWDDVKEQEINISFTKVEIISKFYQLYPDTKIKDEEIKMFFLPHWV
jgi:hypothetical protein